jgi:hypothetical protein
MAFTVAAIVNIVAIAQKKYTASVGLLAVAALALQFFTGLYLFVLRMQQCGAAGDAPSEMV